MKIRFLDKFKMLGKMEGKRKREEVVNSIIKVLNRLENLKGEKIYYVGAKN